MPTIKYKDKTYGASRMGYHNTDAVSDVADDDELPVFDKSANAYKKTLFSSLKSKFWTYVQSQLASVATSGNYNDLSNKPSLNYLPLSGGKLTGALQFASGSSTENPNMPFFLGIDAFADGGEVHWIGKGTVANTIGALKVDDPAKSIYASDGRITSANLSASNSTSLKHLLATSQMATGKPSQDGHIVHMDWDTTAGWGAQLFVPNNDGSGCDMQWRGQNGGTWGNWRSLVDGKNFATNLSSAGISKTKLDGFYAKTFAHNAHTKIVIESTIATGTGYGRQSFFLFSVAGGSLFAIMFFIGTSSGNPVVSYQNVVGNVCSAGVASTRNNHIVGTFTVGARYDESTIMSGYDFIVNADG